MDDRLAVDFPHQQAMVNGTPIQLTPTETKLLYLLMRNAGRVVSAEFLLRRLWPMEEVFEDTLRVHIHRLRQKIEPVPARPHLCQHGTRLGLQFPGQIQMNRPSS